MNRRKLAYERLVPLLALVGAVPAILVALALLWTGEHEVRTRWTLTFIVLGGWLGFAIALRERLIRPLHTVSNLLAALQEGDYSMRAHLGGPENSLGLVAHEINALGTTLREQRLEVLEATALLRRVMQEIGVAVFAFDSVDRLVFANHAGVRLLARSEESMRGRRASSIGLGDLLDGESPRVADLSFPSAASRWEVRVSDFRQDGKPHRLLVLSDLSRVLREEERKAWQRLVRVLGHEINNSLAPIRSIAQSLSSALDAEEALPGGSSNDLRQGLDVISGRSEALARFLSSYARLARLPRPRLESVDVGEWIRRVVELETRMPIEIRPGSPIRIQADGDQLDQLLINLVDNAVDAASETEGSVRVGWSSGPTHLELWVEDDGPGLPDSGNLFVPFFTTKPEGSGIGLALSRQIAEAHHGTLTLADRNGEGGCIAKLRLPTTMTAGRGTEEEPPVRHPPPL